MEGKKVFLTGGTGFVGEEVLKRLLEEGYSVKALVRDKRRLKAKSDRVEALLGDVLQPESFRDALEGVDVAVHLVGIIREFPGKGITFEKLHFEATKNVVDAVRENGVKRFVHMSANGVKEKAQTGYHRTKYKAEVYLKESGLTYTIFRPSVIFGPGDGFVNMLADMMKFLVVPYFGDGSYKLQPVSVKTVADAFVKSIENEVAFNKTYHLCGEKAYSYKELLEIIARASGKNIIKLSFPTPVICTVAALLDWSPLFPVTRDQIKMLLEGNTCSEKKAYDELKLEPVDFEEGIREYLGK